MDTNHHPFEGTEAHQLDKRFPWLPSAPEQTSSPYTNFTLLSQNEFLYFPSEIYQNFVKIKYSNCRHSKKNLKFSPKYIPFCFAAKFSSQLFNIVVPCDLQNSIYQTDFIHALKYEYNRHTICYMFRHFLSAIIRENSLMTALKKCRNM